MKILVIGSVQFSENALKKLIRIDIDLVGVVTKESSTFNSDFVDLSITAKKYQIPFHYTKNINTESSIDWIKDQNPDLIFCLGWSQLLKDEILQIPQKGTVGYHPAKLPENRGRHPLIWAIVLGLEETASTFFLMDAGADTGDIISQNTFPIHFEDRAKDVYDRMTLVALDQIEELVKQFQTDAIQRIPQKKERGNAWRKRGKEDGKIDFRMSSKNIYNLVRALDKPYPGAHFEYMSKDIKVWNTKITGCDSDNLEPGKVLEIKNDHLLVKTGDAAIWLLDHELHELPKKNEYLNDE